MEVIPLQSALWCLAILASIPETLPYSGFPTASGYGFGSLGGTSAVGSSFYTQPYSYFSTSQQPYGYPETHTQQTPYVGYGADYYTSLQNYPGISSNGFSDFGTQQARPLPNCRPSKYRTIDGTCNNLRNPMWGAANTPYGRLLPAKYADGISEPSRALSGEPLPNSRQLSLALFPDVDKPDPIWTLAAMQWGQIMTHDMSLAAGATQGPSHATKCCLPDGSAPVSEQTRHTSCWPIVVGPQDPLARKFGQGCFNFVRTMTDQGLSHRPAEQIVAVTHWMDASMVYGPTDDVARGLRTFQDGQLRVEVRGGRPWPPANMNKTLCEGQNVRFSCYLTGDVRANQNPQLTILQIQLLREHNRLAVGLKEINSHWDDERLYQEARRILIAEIQHISYYEWLPIFLGKENLLRHGVIYNAPHAYVNDYNDKIDPSVLNSHATAAFRYFHTNIQGHLDLVSDGRYTTDSLRLSDYFNKPGIIEEGTNFDDLCRGLATQPQHKTDRFHSSEITDFLFRDKKPFGRDLKAIDIHRGRDHGLASYNSYRTFCGLNRAGDISHFGDSIDPKVLQELSKLFAHVEDVDLNVAGMLERHVPGTLAGPTFLCIMLEQFYRTRVADKYFYEHGKHEGAFTPEQLTEVRKSSIARLMCDNSDEIFSMQSRAFERVSHRNPLVSCDDYNAIPGINLEAWRDKKFTKYRYYNGRK